MGGGVGSNMGSGIGSGMGSKGRSSGARGPRGPAPAPRPAKGPGWEVVEPRRSGKNPFVAALLSLLWPGLGQMYGGRWAKGLVLFFGQLANLVLIFASVGVVSVPALWLWGVVDAFAGARRTARLGRPSAGPPTRVGSIPGRPVLE